MSEMIALDQIRADTKAQPRTSLMIDTIDNYTERMAEGDEFPPLTVFFDGSVYWLADGFHRYHSAVGCGLAEFACEVREGGLRDAILYSVGANAAHGLQRTNEDKRRAVMKLLNDTQWSHWSDREIARRCWVSHEFVRKLRPLTVNVDSEIAPLSEQQQKKIEGVLDKLSFELLTRDEANAQIAKIDPNWHLRGQKRTYTNKHGNNSQMNTGNIGGSRPKPPSDGPVFDNSSFGGADRSRPKSETERLEEMGASRTRAEQIARDNANAFIGIALSNILDEMRPLPNPRDAARRCSAGDRYAHTADEFERVARWFSEFADEWRCIDQKERANVAAE
jgi:hypothetical protein